MNTKDRELDKQLRNRAEIRKPLIREDDTAPRGFIDEQDARDYLTRRFGQMIGSDIIAQITDRDIGPKGIISGSNTFFAFDTLDLWAFRKISGLPAAWLQIGNADSTMPQKMITNHYDWDQYKKTGDLKHLPDWVPTKTPDDTP